jgi:hypothetical protein
MSCFDGKVNKSKKWKEHKDNFEAEYNQIIATNKWYQSSNHSFKKEN